MLGPDRSPTSVIPRNFARRSLQTRSSAIIYTCFSLSGLPMIRIVQMRP